MALLPAGIGAVGDLLGGIFGSNSAKDQLEEQQRFYRQMRDTQYQATVKDMKAAGLNPMMLYHGGGLSQGASIAGPDAGEKITRGAQGASAKMANGALMAAQIGQINSARKLTEAQTEAQNLQNYITENTFTGENYTPGLKVKPNMIVPGGIDIPADLSPMTKGRRNAAEQAMRIATMGETYKNIKAMTGQAASQTELNQMTAALTKAREIGAQYGLSQAKVDSEFWAEFGKWGKRAEFAGGLGSVAVKILQGLIMAFKQAKGI